MDRIVSIIVRLVVALGGWAHVLFGADHARPVPGEKIKILLVGYNGARNTGSDVRVAALDYAYDNRERVSAQLASRRVALEARLHDMASWFYERVQTAL